MKTLLVETTFLHSDEYEELFIADDPQVSNNPGAKYLVKKNDEKKHDLEVSDKVRAVKLEDILELLIFGSTFILKLDLEGFDCQVLSSTELHETYNIPFIFIEWQIVDKACQDLKPKLRALGYTPYW